MRRRLERLVLWAALALALATGCAWLAPLGWPFELFSHFRVQYVVAWAVLAAALLALRRVAPAGAALLVALGLAGSFVAAGQTATNAHACHGAALTVATANVHFRNADHGPLRQWLARARPDLVVLQEVTPAWIEALQGLAGYPQRAAQPRSDAYGLAALSRLSLESLQSVDLAGDGYPSFAATARVDGQPFGVLGVHARWPITPRLAVLRDTALAEVVARARRSPVPLVVLGDFNLSPWSPAYRRLLDDSGLRDAASGRGWQPTWLAGFWPLALRIDHVLVSPGVCVEGFEVGPRIGSDHRPVLARLRLP